MRWGKFFWTTIHVAALGYPDNATEMIRSQYRTFYANLGHVLPCSKCRRNYAEHFSELPIDLYLYDKTSLFAWTVKLHNIVNKDTGKREWTVEEATTHYTTGKYATDPTDTTDALGPNHRAQKQTTVDILITLNAIILISLLAFIGFRIFQAKSK